MPTNSTGYIVVLLLEEYVRVSVVEDSPKREINMFGSDNESKKNGFELSSLVCWNVGVGWGSGCTIKEY
jgi:hypothetical protein